MKQGSFKKAVNAFTVIAIFITVIWIISGKSNSYSEPQEAIFAVENDLVLIPAYKINRNALFFFIKDKNNLGATYVRKGLFGWKAEFLSWRPMDYERNYENLNGYQGHGENLIFGLVKDSDDLLIQLGDKSAKILNLEMLPTEVVEEYQLAGLYIWYFEIDTALEEGKIRLINNTTEEVIEEIDL
ncbi:aspartyl-tRNA synthetase [Solibacillus sp. A46]|uniref:Aspartyl-tRNA synthetase n=1 Tax=Solibacillus faecavium TaxID=2762221 RepID=A0ABR8XWP8_9BACL|nr:aspartyl-tRNA synthetase [Solibacillus faecavium]MBD8036367.1 aspartyl-tRNA synthetase [Solibacillus faecavium]